MWEINSNSQILTFIFSIFLGFFLGVFYDFLRSIRFVMKRKKLFIFVTDLFFSLLYSISVFCFALQFANGFIRGYYLVGSLLGFILNFITVSQFTLKIFKKIFFTLNGIFAKFSYAANIVIDKIIIFLDGIRTKICIFLKKYLKCGKKP